ncbi:hypothetical protein D3C78_1284850 [compost metagenome]
MPPQLLSVPAIHDGHAAADYELSRTIFVHIGRPYAVGMIVQIGTAPEQAPVGAEQVIAGHDLFASIPVHIASPWKMTRISLMRP